MAEKSVIRIGGPMRSAMLMTAALALMAQSSDFMAGSEDVEVSGPKARPAGYGVHLSKAERRGKTCAELQAMREERQHA